MEKLGFDDFIVTVDGALTDFVTELHQELLASGCKLEVKEAKSGYVVSYLYNKKTIVNYVFRKKGVIARIYANHIMDYMELLDRLPDGMAKAVKDAPDCKRLLNPTACNPRCSMGFDFIMQGERYQKCRYNAFMFLLSDENNPHIKALLKSEIEASAREK